MVLKEAQSITEEASTKPVAGIERQHRESVLIWLHLARVFQRIEQSHRELLAEFDLTPAQFDVLSQLAGQPGLHQQELADRLLVTKGNVCGLLDRLEQVDLVERRPDPEDRRANTLHLTERGLGRFAEAAPALEHEINEHFRGLSSGQQKELRQLIGALDRSLRS